MSEVYIPPRPFLPNGCSRVPDGAWKTCCDEHDLHYYCGGSLAAKLRADARLAHCIEERLSARALDLARPLFQRAWSAMGAAFVPPLYFAGVTLLGWTPWHWSYTRRAPPTDEQLAALEGVDRDRLHELARALRDAA